MNKEKQKLEAIKRMKAFNMDKWCIQAFEEDNRVWRSERNIVPGVLYEINYETRVKIEKIEKETGSLVYHCVLTHTNHGPMLAYLLVSKYKREWESEHTKDGDLTYLFSYVENKEDDYMSEYGSIAVEPANGGLVRVL